MPVNVKRQLFTFLFVSLPNFILPVYMFFLRQEDDDDDDDGNNNENSPLKKKTKHFSDQLRHAQDSGLRGCPPL